MNDDQHAYWNAYIRECADLFGLRDWRIKLERQYAESSDAAAECRVWENQKGASIYLTDWFMKQYGQAEQRETVAHELFHCHDYRLRKLVREYVQPEKDNEKNELFWNLFCREYEHLCDAVSFPFSLFLPLPENRPNPLPVDGATP